MFHIFSSVSTFFLKLFEAFSMVFQVKVNLFAQIWGYHVLSVNVCVHVSLMNVHERIKATQTLASDSLS